jgi:hypothetical protein
MTAVPCTLEELELLEGALTEETVDALDDRLLTQLLLWRFRHFLVRGSTTGEALLRAAGFPAAEANMIAFRLGEEPKLVH